MRIVETDGSWSPALAPAAAQNVAGCWRPRSWKVTDFSAQRMPRRSKKKGGTKAAQPAGTPPIERGNGAPPIEDLATSPEPLSVGET